MRFTYRGILLISLLLPLLGIGGYFLFLELRPPNEGERRFEEAIQAIQAREEATPEAQRGSASLMREEAIEQASDQWFDDLLIRYPWMSISYRDVPEEDNGFAQWIQFVDSTDYIARYDHNPSLIPDEISEMSWDEESYDRSKLEDLLRKHQELLDEILRIAELPQQSSKDVDPAHLIDLKALPVKQAGDILLLQGRLAMEQGNPDKAIRYYGATMNFADHFDAIETPCLLYKTVTILIRLGVHGSFHEHILPHIMHDSQALSAWRETMRYDRPFADEMIHMLRGEWHTTTRAWILPALVDNQSSELDDMASIRDQQALLDALANHYDFIFKTLRSPAGMTGSAPTLSPPSVSPKISAKAMGIYEVCSIGVDSWIRGSMRAHSLFAMHDALIGIALGEPPAKEPFTGTPFLWDPSTRTLSAPPGSPEEIDPLVLPPAP